MTPGSQKKPSTASVLGPTISPTVPGGAKVKIVVGVIASVIVDKPFSVAKIKRELITKAKVKKQYAKIKAQHQKQAAAEATVDSTIAAGDETITRSEPQTKEHRSAPAPTQIHPARQAMLDSSSRPRPDRQTSDDNNTANKDRGDDSTNNPTSPRQERRQRRPGRQRPDYFSKERAAAERAKKQAEERAAERTRREQERQQRSAERERYRKAMAKAKAPGRDGKRKIGREGKVLLERVKKLTGES